MIASWIMVAAGLAAWAVIGLQAAGLWVTAPE